MRYVALAALLLAGCSGLTGPDTVPAGSPNEVYIIARSHELAGDVSVNPMMTYERYMVTSSDGTRKVPAAGWVPNGGRSHDIYYWSPWVNDANRTHGELDSLARHEVAHVLCQCALGEK